MITRQSQIVAYTDTFWILAVLLVVSLPLLLLVKPPRPGAGKDVQIHLD
jgi:DHA2 family multidrug resistance protein